MVKGQIPKVSQDKVQQVGRDQAVRSIQRAAVVCQCDRAKHKGASFYIISTCVCIHLSDDKHQS